METLSLSRRRSTLIACALVALALPACEIWLGRPPELRAREATERSPSPVEPTRADRGTPASADAEDPPISVEPETGGRDGEPARDDERAEQERKSPLFAIEAYPPNPRCYAGGRYIPAPPLCPSI